MLIYNVVLSKNNSIPEAKMGIWVLAAVSSFIVVSMVDFIFREKNKINNRWESKTLFGLASGDGNNESIKNPIALIAGLLSIAGSLLSLAIIFVLCLNGFLFAEPTAYYEHVGVWTPIIFSLIGAAAYWPITLSRNLWRWIGTKRREAVTSGTRLVRWAETRATQLCYLMNDAKWSEVRIQVNAVAKETIPRLLRRMTELTEAIKRTEALVDDTEGEDCDPALVQRTVDDLARFREQLTKIKGEIAYCRHFLIYIESDIIAANLAEDGETDARNEVNGIAGKVAEVNSLSQATGDEVGRTERAGNGLAAHHRAQTVR